MYEVNDLSVAGVLCWFVNFFFSSRRRHTRSYGDWSSDVCSSDLEADGRPRRRHVRVAVGPRTDDRHARHGQPLHEARDRIRVRVRPTAHGEDRAGDGTEVLADRAVLVVGVPPLVTEPGLEPEPAL